MKYQRQKVILYTFNEKTSNRIISQSNDLISIKEVVREKRKFSVCF
jgi:hypothetical protein